MSEKKLKKTRVGRHPEAPVDERCFAEIWFSLPEAGQSMLLDALRKKNLSRTTLYLWLNGRVPQATNMAKLRRSLRECFGIHTIPYTLFPGTSVEERKALAEKYKERRLCRTDS